MINKFRSEKFVIAIQSSTSYNKVLQIIFSKKDGSLFVNFPYFSNSNGIVSIMKYDGDGSYKKDLSLASQGKVTSHLVKYSHHPDGRVHFSQDKKIRTSVVKQSVPLEKLEGHVFTATVQGITGYTPVDISRDSKRDEHKTLLTFRHPSTDNGTYNIAGRWFSDEYLLKQGNGVGARPDTLSRTPDGRVLSTFLIGAPSSFPLSNYTLVITCEHIQPLSKDQETALIFVGGFDNPSVVNNLATESNFLALKYPASEYDELFSKIGSVDL